MLIVDPHKIGHLFNLGLQTLDLVHVFQGNQLQFLVFVQLALPQLNPKCLYYVIVGN